MFVIQSQVVIFTERWFLVGFQTDISTHVEGGEKRVLVAFLTSDEFVSHAVVDVEQIVGVLTCIPLHLTWEGPTKQTRENKQRKVVLKVLQKCFKHFVFLMVSNR